MLREAHHLILTPDRGELMVGDSGGNELIFIDPVTAEVTRREKFSNPYHMELSPDGRLLVVTSLRRDQVDIYEAATRTLLARLKVPDKPSHLAYTPDSRIAFVTLQGARRLMAIDLVTYKPLWSAEVGPQPAGVTWHNGKLLVGIIGSDYVAVVNPVDGKVERTIFAGRGAHTVFPSPDRKLLYVNSRVDSRITVLDGETLEPRAHWDLPGGPDCIAFDPRGRLWVTLRWTGRLAIVDPASGECGDGAGRPLAARRLRAAAGDAAAAADGGRDRAAGRGHVHRGRGGAAGAAAGGLAPHARPMRRRALLGGLAGGRCGSGPCPGPAGLPRHRLPDHRHRLVAGGRADRRHPAPARGAGDAVRGG